MLGIVNKRIDLSEGFNTIIVDATDTAGNRMSREMFISRDSNPPTLYVYSPRQNEETGNGTIVLTGLTDPDINVEVRVESTLGTNAYLSKSIDDGTFEISVELFEGLQKILVIATDSAGNPNQTYRDVTLDTSAPGFVVNNPPTLQMITKDVRIEIICTMLPGGLDATTYIGGQEVPNEGVFKRWIVLQEGDNVIDIKAIDPTGNEEYKEISIFRDTIVPVLEVTTPATESVLTRQPSVLFAGTIQGGAIANRVIVVHKTIENPATLMSGSWEDGGEWELNLPLGPDDLEQYITVVAKDLAGNEVFTTFYVVYDIIPPSLNLDPINDTTDSPILTVSGATDVEVPQIFFQGVSFPVTDGEFSLAWPLAEGLNNFSVMCMDKAGNEAIKTISLTYTPKEIPQIKEPEEDKGWQSFIGWILILAAVTLIVTAIFVSSSRTKRRDDR
jgi:hypothetical protein